MENDLSKPTDHSRTLRQRLPYRKIGVILLILCIFSIAFIYPWYNKENNVYSILCSGHSTGEPKVSLGGHLRFIDAPQDARPDTGFKFSLYDEALHLTDISPYLNIITSGGNEVGYYGVSMYHQLHCLDMLRGAITSRKRSEHHDHLIHCIDYISQVRNHLFVCRRGLMALTGIWT